MPDDAESFQGVVACIDINSGNVLAWLYKPNEHALYQSALDKGQLVNGSIIMEGTWLDEPIPDLEWAGLYAAASEKRYWARILEHDVHYI